MKTIEKFIGVSPQDITDSIPILKDTFNKSVSSYR